MQFGFEMMPFGRVKAASAFTSGTTSGTSGSIRNAPELSTAIAPRSAAIGAHCADTSSGTSNIAMSTPSKASGDSAIDLDLATADAQPLAGRARRGDEADVAPQVLTLVEQPEHHRADRAGGADDGEGRLATPEAGRPRRRRRGAACTAGWPATCMVVGSSRSGTPAVKLVIVRSPYRPVPA